MKTKTKDMIMYALFAALTGVLSQISIPIPFTPVPINLAVIAPFLAGALLGTGGGAVSQIVYVILGVSGLPVFAAFTSGIGILFGPTGGYIIGYVAIAIIVGLFTAKGSNKYHIYILSMITGLMGCYVIGTLWFMHVTGSGFVESLVLCVIPFLVGDTLKILISSYLAVKLKKHINI